MHLHSDELRLKTPVVSCNCIAVLYLRTHTKHGTQHVCFSSCDHIQNISMTRICLRSNCKFDQLRLVCSAGVTQVAGNKSTMSSQYKAASAASPADISSSHAATRLMADLSAFTSPAAPHMACAPPLYHHHVHLPISHQRHKSHCSRVLRERSCNFMHSDLKAGRPVKLLLSSCAQNTVLFTCNVQHQKFGEPRS